MYNDTIFGSCHTKCGFYEIFDVESLKVVILGIQNPVRDLRWIILRKQRLIVIKYFRKMLPCRCLAEFWIHFVGNIPQKFSSRSFETSLKRFTCQGDSVLLLTHLPRLIDSTSRKALRTNIFCTSLPSNCKACSFIKKGPHPHQRSS